MKLSVIFLSVFVTACPGWAGQQADTTRLAGEFFSAIRANDLSALKQLCKSTSGDVRDRLEWTPLHYAALYGSTDALRIILAAGGDPNARNKFQATPLIYAAFDGEKTRLLVEKGGDVNAKAKDGSTPLWVAAAIPGNEKTVQYLISKSAQVKEVHRSGADYLIRAAAHQDATSVRLLLDQGLDPHRSSVSGNTALMDAVNCDGGKKARVLLEAGADVNVFNISGGSVKNGPIESTGVTPLMLAATCGEADLVASLLKAGAKVDTVDHRHMTALMMAVAVDHAKPDTARLLIAAGANVNTADRYSETALDWARKYRNPELLALLEKAGARGKGLADAPVRPADYQPSAREAIGRASALLVKSNDVFFREGGGCLACHHQPFAGRAFAEVKIAGLPVEPRLRQTLLDGMGAERARDFDRLPLMNMGGGGYTTLLYPLAGMADMDEPALPVNDPMLHYIAVNQDTDGSWSAAGSRPPLQESGITQTMLAIYALKTYGWPARRAEFDARIARARRWLETTPASTTVEEADRLMGLWLANAPAAELKEMSGKLSAKQRADGGWAQTRYLESDSFGTAAALYTLRKTGFLTASDAVYTRGAKYLLSTQFPDGSWYVRSRVVKLQPYFQSAFPYDHDQWISVSATAYAVMALAPVAALER